MTDGSSGNDLALDRLAVPARRFENGFSLPGWANVFETATDALEKPADTVKEEA
jgi:hypothetical protein